MKQQITITPRTESFINALADLEHAKESFYDALVCQYGEEDGQRQFAATMPEWESVTAQISKFLIISISEHFAARKKDGQLVEI